MHYMNCNFIEAIINNGRVLQLAQREKDDPILVTTYNMESGLVDSETEIAPGDLVMLINYYRQQKEKGQPLL